MLQIAQFEFRNAKFPYALQTPPGGPGGQPRETPVIGQQFAPSPFSSGWTRPLLFRYTCLKACTDFSLSIRFHYNFMVVIPGNSSTYQKIVVSIVLATYKVYARNLHLFCFWILLCWFIYAYLVRIADFGSKSHILVILDKTMILFFFFFFFCA